MGWGKCETCAAKGQLLTTYQALVNSLRSEAQDLRDEMNKREAAWVAERKELVERVMALTSPGAVMALRPREPRAAAPAGPMRLQFPGFEPNLRPPSPGQQGQQKSAPVGAIPNQDKGRPPQE